MQTTNKPPFGSRRTQLDNVDQPPYTFDSILKQAIESAVEVAVEAKTKVLLSALDQAARKALQMSPMDELRLMSVKEVSQLLDVHENTVRKLLDYGYLRKQPVRRNIRISVPDLRAYLESERNGEFL
jgi:excisionase family DNA binding protein